MIQNVAIRTHRRLLPEEDAIIGPDDEEADPDSSLPADLWF